MRKDYGRVLLFGVTAFLLLLIMKYVLPYFLPFIVALMVVVPLHHFCLKKGKIRDKGRGIMAGGILFVLLLFIALLFVGFSTFMLSKAQSFVGNITRIEETCSLFLAECCSRLETYMGLGEGIMQTWLQERLYRMFGTLGMQSSSWLTQTMHYLVNMGKFCSFALVSFICVVLFAREIDAWQQGLLTAAVASPALDRLLAILLRIGKKLGGMMKTFIKTQSIILCCISVTAVAGLYLGGINEAWFYGILAGIMDVLPFIGTGIVLVPLGVMQLINGRLAGGAIVLVTYLACVCIREILEPRLMGNGTRVSPVAMLIAVYAGVLFYGVGGVLLGPVTLLILVETAREIFK